jgi:predicted nucleic acid-binding Zn ribbon protein
MSWDDDETDDTMDCPYCGESIFDDSERCPHCEKYLSREDAPSRTPIWIGVCALLALGAALTWVFAR